MSPPMTPTMRAILQDVSERRRVSVKDLLGESRAHNIARPRQEAMALMYATGKYSLPRIGAVFNRDHTTVLHACRIAKERAQAE